MLAPAFICSHKCSKVYVIVLKQPIETRSSDSGKWTLQSEYNWTQSRQAFELMNGYK